MHKCTERYSNVLHWDSPSTLASASLVLSENPVWLPFNCDSAAEVHSNETVCISTEDSPFSWNETKWKHDQVEALDEYLVLNMVLFCVTTETQTGTLAVKELV